MEKSWGYCKNKTENQKQEAYVQMMRTRQNFWLQGTLFYRSSSNASICTLKPSTIQEPTSSRAKHTTQILQQHRNIALSFNIQACPKSLQTHWHLITHYWTLHCTPERRNPAPPTRTPTQASLTRKLWWATHLTWPTARSLHNNKNSTNCQNTERPPQTEPYKQNEETEEYPAGKGTGGLTTKPNKRGRDTESTWEIIPNNDSEKWSKILKSKWNHR